MTGRQKLAPPKPQEGRGQPRSLLPPSRGERVRRRGSLSQQASGRSRRAYRCPRYKGHRGSRTGRGRALDSEVAPGRCQSRGRARRTGAAHPTPAPAERPAWGGAGHIGGHFAGPSPHHSAGRAATEALAENAGSELRFRDGPRPVLLSPSSPDQTPIPAHRLPTDSSVQQTCPCQSQRDKQTLLGPPWL